MHIVLQNIIHTALSPFQKTSFFDLRVWRSGASIGLPGEPWGGPGNFLFAQRGALGPKKILVDGPSEGPWRPRQFFEVPFSGKVPFGPPFEVQTGLAIVKHVVISTSHRETIAKHI